MAHTASRLALAASLTLAGAGTWAADPDPADHTAHHPADAASAPKAAPVQKPAAKPASVKPVPAPMVKGAMDKGTMEKMGQMDAQMKTMQDLHQKFMAAQTAEERNALMPEQMKAMQEAMTAMEGMRGMGGMGMMGGKEKGQMMMDKMPPDMMAKHQMMGKRMDMMQSMMQMMMDRMQAPATQ
jgi:hypothetical protein